MVDECPIAPPSDAETILIYRALEAMKMASSEVLPDPLEWMSFSAPAAAMLAGFIYRTAVLTGIEPDTRKRCRLAIKAFEAQFRHGMKVADFNAPAIAAKAGIVQ